MISDWTKHLKDPEEKARFEKSLLNSRWILDRQAEMLDGVERGLDRQECSPKAYDNVNWAFRQAHANGYRQCLRDLKTINNLDQKENNERPIQTG